MARSSHRGAIIVPVRRNHDAETTRGSREVAHESVGVDPRPVRNQRQAYAGTSRGRCFVDKLLPPDHAEASRRDSIDYGASSFKERRRLEESLPFRVRAREMLCGSGAFFSLFGWRFLRRSLRGIWRPQLSYTLFTVAFLALMEALPVEVRGSVENSMRSVALLFDFTRVFLIFTLTAVVGTMYNRWWEMRKLVGVIMGKTQDTTIMVATYIQGEDTADLKCDLVRYLNLAQVLTHMQAREKHGLEPLFTLDQLQQCDLIDAKERCILQSHEHVVGLHAVAYMWFLQLWLGALSEELVPSIVASAVHKAVQSNVTAMRGAAGNIAMHQGTPPPAGYFRVLYLLLNVSLLIAPLGVYANLLDKKASGHTRWMVVPVVFIITFFLLSFIHMCREMFDPFAEGLSNFPLKTYLGSAMRSSYALLEMPRVGRLRYYRTMGPFKASSEQAPDVQGTQGSSDVVQEEQQLRMKILQRRASTGSMSLFGSCLQDPAERDALQDLHEGHCLLGRVPSRALLGGTWMAEGRREQDGHCAEHEGDLEEGAKKTELEQLEQLEHGHMFTRIPSARRARGRSVSSIN